MERIIIENQQELLNGGGESTRLSLELLETGINSVLPQKVIREKVRIGKQGLEISGDRVDLGNIEHIYLIGAGKASAEMAKPIVAGLGSRITEGIIITKQGNGGAKGIEVVEAGHPVPDEAGMQAAKKILELSESATEDDLVICLISGGGSALLPLPVAQVTLEEVSETTQLLMDSGATIDQINAVRKHISEIKGGKLARALHPAKCLVLLISDVVGDPLEVIASGPTAADPTTFGDAINVLEELGLRSEVPKSVLNYLKVNSGRRQEETVKKNEFAKLSATNYILANNLTALKKMEQAARKRNYNTLILSSMIEGESREVGILHGGLLRSMYREEKPVEKPAVLFSGGETTVTMPEGGGTGGPNQEFVLGAATKIGGLGEAAVAAVDTDGEDGGGCAAGGIVSSNCPGLDLREIRRALNNHDSLNFLREISGLIHTGPTGTNVNDLRLLMVL